MNIRFHVVAMSLLSVLVFSAFSQVTKKVAISDSNTVKQVDSTKVSDTLLIRARLIEVPGTFPPNDLYNYVYIMKYKVLSVDTGTFTGKEIFVGHYNPLIPRSQVNDKMDPFVNGDVKKFEAGSTHLLKLVAPIESVWNSAIEDDYFDSDSTKYFAISTDIINK